MRIKNEDFAAKKSVRKIKMLSGAIILKVILAGCPDALESEVDDDLRLCYRSLFLFTLNIYLSWFSSFSGPHYSSLF